MPFFVAMAPSGQGSANILVQIFPFVADAAASSICWCSCPCGKRQKKVQEFQAALKVGDRVIMTSGIYGQMTRVSEASVQVQVADKVQSRSRPGVDRRLSGPGPGGAAGVGRTLAHAEESSLENPHLVRRDGRRRGGHRAAVEEDPSGPRPPGRHPSRHEGQDRRRAPGRDGDVGRRVVPGTQGRQGSGDRAQDHEHHLVRVRQPAVRRRRAGAPALGLAADRLRPSGNWLDLHVHDAAEHPEPAPLGGRRRRPSRRSRSAWTSWACPSRSWRRTATPATRSSSSCPACPTRRGPRTSSVRRPS